MGAEYFNFECVEGLNANVNNGRRLYIHPYISDLVGPPTRWKNGPKIVSPLIKST